MTENYTEPPMGVSKWINHGECYGYSSFLKKKVATQAVTDILKTMQAICDETENEGGRILIETFKKLL